MNNPQVSIMQQTESSQAAALTQALEILFEGDFEERWEVAKVIPKLGDIAIQPLLNSLNDNDLDLEDRWFVARILGDFPRAEVVMALIELVQQNEAPELVEMASSAMAKMGVVAIAPLANLLNPSDGTAGVPAHRTFAVTALAQIRRSQTIEPLLSATDDVDVQIRTLAVEALSSFHDARIPPILIEKLTDVAASVRKAAVTGLCLRSELAVALNLAQLLRPLLFDLNLAVCEATALGLARLPDPAVVEILLQVSTDPHTPPTLRAQTILSLGWVGTKPAIAGLSQMLMGASSELAIEIITSISKIEYEQTYASELLVAYLYSKPEHPVPVKQEIATALGNLGNIATVSDLVGLLSDRDDRVKLYTISAIAKLSPTIPPQIVELASRSDLSPEVKNSVRLCLLHWNV